MSSPSAADIALADELEVGVSWLEDRSPGEVRQIQNDARSKTMARQYFKHPVRIDPITKKPTDQSGKIYCGRTMKTDAAWYMRHVSERGAQALPLELGTGIYGGEMEGFVPFVRNGGLWAIDPDTGDYWMSAEQVIELGLHTNPAVLQGRPDVATLARNSNYICDQCPGQRPFISAKAYMGHRSSRHKDIVQNDHLADQLTRGLTAALGGQQNTSASIVLDTLKMLAENPALLQSLIAGGNTYAPAPTPVAEVPSYSETPFLSEEDEPVGVADMKRQGLMALVKERGWSDRLVKPIFNYKEDELRAFIAAQEDSDVR